MLGRRVLSRRRRRLSLLSAVAVGVAALPAVPSFVGSAQAALVTVEANADATVAEATPDTNAGAASTVEVDGSPAQEGFLRFPAAGSGTVERATLRLYALDPTLDAPTVHVVTGTWSESTITWNNRPTPVATPVADAGSVVAGTWVEYDVTGAVTAGAPVAFALKPEGTDGVDFASRSASSNRPHLVVETVAAPVPAATHTFAPSADARVEEESPQTNFGSDDQLGNQDDPDPLIDSYLRFDVAGLGSSVRKATLRLLITGSGDGPSVRPAGGSWTEATINWLNRPAPTGDAVGNFGSVSRGWEELDVTALVRGNGAVNLLLTGGSDDSVQIRSREGEAGDRPQLVVETTGTSSSTSPTTGPTTTTTRPPTTTTTTRPSQECADSWDSADLVGELPSGRGEMSGLVASSANPGWGWGVRDSGNPAALYSFRIGSGGNITSDEFLVPGASNSDWEDTVYTRTSTGAGRVWVLENVGNGHTGNRRIYEIAEPDPDRPGNADLLQRYDWAYPDAQYNSEVLFLFDGDLAVISKTSPSRVYRFFEPLRAGVVNRPTFVGILPTGSNLSVASMSPDNRFMVVASHSSMYVYENNGTLDDLGDLIAASPVFSQKPPSDNRESGGFFPYGSCDIVLVAESKNVWRSSQ